MIRNYEDLEVFKKSYNVALELYKRTKDFPREELLGLISQIKRAATSIPLNIAEGYGKRESVKEFKRYLLMSVGSCDEMKVLLNFSCDLGYITRAEYERYRELYNEVGKMLNGLRSKWENK